MKSAIFIQPRLCLVLKCVPRQELAILVYKAYPQRQRNLSCKRFSFQKSCRQASSICAASPTSPISKPLSSNNQTIDIMMNAYYLNSKETDMTISLKKVGTVTVQTATTTIVTRCDCLFLSEYFEASRICNKNADLIN